MVKKLCFIEGCYSQNDSCPFFSVPKNNLKQWQDMIPKKGLLQKSRLCSLHFDDDDIIKGRMIAGIFYAQKLWRLKIGALPKHFLGTPSTAKHDQPLQSLSNKQGNDSLPTTSLQISANQDKEKLIDSLLTKTENQKADVENCTVEMETIDNFDEPTVNTSTGYHDSPIDLKFFQEMKNKVKLPTIMWQWSFNDKSKSAICFTWLHEIDGSLHIKTLSILSTNRVSFHVGGKTISLSKSCGVYHSFEQLSELLASFHSQNPCRGILNRTFNNPEVTGKCSVIKDGDVLRSTKCTYLAGKKSHNELCEKCSMTVRLLRRRLLKGKNNNSVSRKLKIAQQKIRRMQSREMIFSLELKDMQKKCRSLLGQVQDGSFDALVK